MGMRIDKARRDNAPARVNDLYVASVLLDLIARPNLLDFAIAHNHSAVANDRELRHLWPNSWAPWSRQRDKLRRVKIGERSHEQLFAAIFRTGPTARPAVAPTPVCFQ